MRRAVKHLIVPGLAALVVVAVAGCGEEDAELLPGGTASEINANLDAVKQLSDEGDCVGAESAAQQVSEQVEALGGIDPKLKRALENGARKLNEVVDECEEAEPEPVETSPTEEEAPEADEDEERKQEDRERKEQKEQEKEQRESERDEREREGEQGPGSEGEGPPEEKPGKGGGPPPAPPGQSGEEPSGGVEPADPVDEGEDD